jgi:N-acetylmuramoyl-L-alanine amidase
MTDSSEGNAWTARSVLSGLVPTRPTASSDCDTASMDAAALEPSPTRRDKSKFAKSVFATVPIVLVGSMAVAMNLTGPIEPAHAKRPLKPKTTTSELGKTIRDALTAANAAVRSTKTGPIPTSATAALTSAPTTYRVVAGDTVSSIAGRYGLSTASVLAHNGLSWKSIIFPGQVLKLTNGPGSAHHHTTPKPSATFRYRIAQGDTISAIASHFGLKTQTLLSANGLSWSSIIYPGQTLAIPGHAVPASSNTPKGETSTPVVSSPSPSNKITYAIVAGDTISSIAKKFGVSMQSLLKANDLTWESIIYTGTSLVIPGSIVTTASTGSVRLTDEMAENARIIIAVGKDLGVSDYGIVIALAAAMQESNMRNIAYGDRDSLGLFQQRPSAGWGSKDQLLNATHATKLFYGGPKNPNSGKTRGLLDIDGWNNLTVTQAAQKVQVSAYPDAYAKWEASARAWLAALS